MKHMKKRVAALLLTLAMVLSLAPMAFAADEFPDMPAEDDPSYAAVKSAVDNAIMTGENGELNLEGTILRSTVAKMVVTAFAAKGEADLSGYPDVMDGAWYASWMAKANQMGIMTGTSGKMNPGSEVTLAEVAAMLCRALGLSVDKDATVEGVAAWAAPYVKALIDAKYITAEDAAAAHEPMTRGAFAEVIYKVSGEGNYAKEENAEITEDVNGNIVITANGVSLKGITVKGDIIIADGVDAGSVVLDGVKVEGRIVVRGAGAELTNGTTASSTVVAATTGEATVKADDGSDAGDIAVAGTNGMAADKVVIDMAEPKVTVTTATEVAVQNAEGGEITLQAPNASLSVESGTVANVTVADGASGVKVDVAEGATIDKVTTNTDLAVTGEGTVTEKAGSGTVTDGSGNEVAGSDEPVEVPTVEEPAPEVDPNAPTNGTHTHNYTVYHEFDATRHTKSCAVMIDSKGNVKPANAAADASGYAACGAVIYEEHNFVEVTADGPNKGKFLCVCGAAKPAEPTTSDVTPGEHTCGGTHVFANIDDEGNVAVSCTVDGKQKQQCTNKVTVTKDDGTTEEVRCTATQVVTTPATGHSLTVDETVAPTCGTPGSTTFKCTKCEDFEPSEENGGIQVIPATNQHNWKLGEGENMYAADQAPTCSATGFYHYVCANADCGKTPATDDTQPAPKLPHSFTGTVTAIDGDDTHHNVKCATCAETKVVSCTFTADNDGAEEAVAATCKAEGKTAKLACECGNVIGGVTIPKLDHNFSTAWEKDDTNHWHQCKNADCSEKTDVAAHTGENSCTICGWTKGGDSTGPSDEPCTNERNHATLHTGQKCPNCDYVGTAPHDSDKCPGQACSCGVANAKGTGSHSWKGGGEDTPGTCEKCNTQCSDATHADCGCGFVNENP